MVTAMPHLERRYRFDLQRCSSMEHCVVLKGFEWQVQSNDEVACVLDGDVGDGYLDCCKFGFEYGRWLLQFAGLLFLFCWYSAGTVFKNGSYR